MSNVLLLIVKAIYNNLEECTRENEKLTSGK